MLSKNVAIAATDLNECVPTFSIGIPTPPLQSPLLLLAKILKHLLTMKFRPPHASNKRAEEFP